MPDTPTPTAADEEAAKGLVAKHMFGAGMPDTSENRAWAGAVESDIAVALARVRENAVRAASKAVSGTDLTWKVAEALAITQSNECEPDTEDPQYDGGEWRIEADQCLEQAAAAISAMRSFMLAEQREAREAYGALCAAAARKEALEQAANVAEFGNPETGMGTDDGYHADSWTGTVRKQAAADIRALALPLNQKPKEEAHDA
mgnify:CR=1 FL=1